MVSFVILHYKNLEETYACVESIKKNASDYKIVIVENGSENGSDVELLGKYKNDVNVQVIVNEKNEGFSKGNNLGYKYAKNNYLNDFIIVLNSDVVIEDDQIIKKIEKLYSKYEFHIYGPDIVTNNGIHQNPLRFKELDLRKFILKQYVKKILLKYLIIKNRFKKILKNDYIEKKYLDKEWCQPNYEKEAVDVALHGSFYVFSDLFIRENNNIFEPTTFLYMEENILFNNVKYKGYRTLYHPEIQVLHKCGASTGITDNNVVKKRINRLERMIAAGEIYIKLRQERN